MDARSRHDGQAAPGLRRRAASGSTSGAIGTATGSSNTSVARPPASSTKAGRTRTTASSTPTDRLRRGRSRSSRCRVTSTRRSSGSPTSMRLSVIGRASSSCGPRRPPCGRRSTRRSGTTDDGFFALALDGDKAQVRSVTSNPAHCLYCGIVDDDKAALVAERLMAPDMFSGWGIRTLSSSSPAYNPMSYHNGSVWPHDNAIAAAGLKRYGFDAATERIATALFDVAAGARDFRLPELLLRLPARRIKRDRRLPRRVYPPGVGGEPRRSCSSQAMLGISAHAPEHRVAVDRPRLPEWLAKRRDPRHARRALDGQPCLPRSPDRAAPGSRCSSQQGDVGVTMSM